MTFMYRFFVFQCYLTLLEYILCLCSCTLLHCIHKLSIYVCSYTCIHVLIPLAVLHMCVFIFFNDTRVRIMMVEELMCGA